VPNVPGPYRKFYAELLAALKLAAEGRFLLDIPGNDGITQREMLLERRARTGRHEPDLDTAPVPDGCGHVLGWFNELSAGRGNNGFGPNAIPATEVAAWCMLTCRRLQPWEFRALRILDAAWLRAWAEMHVVETEELKK
jgi:hypothetical protein